MKKRQQYSGLTTLEVLEGADNYNAWIAQTIKPHLKSPIIELGAGTGNISTFFTKTKNFTISEVDEVLLGILTDKFTNLHVGIENIDLTRKIPKNLNGIYNSAFAINVLEHIDDDKTAMVNARALLKDKGKLVLLVPAKKFAYSRLDKNLGHFRRYEPSELHQKLTDAGFVVQEIRYFNLLGLLSWIVRDKIEKQHLKLSKAQISLFDKIVPALSHLEGAVKVPVGISLVAVARKHD